MNSATLWSHLPNAARIDQLFGLIESDSNFAEHPVIIELNNRDTIVPWSKGRDMMCEKGLDLLYEQCRTAHYRFGPLTNIVSDTLVVLLVWPEMDYLFNMPVDQIKLLGALGNTAAELLWPYLAVLESHKQKSCDPEVVAV